MFLSYYFLLLLQRERLYHGTLCLNCRLICIYVLIKALYIVRIRLHYYALFAIKYPVGQYLKSQNKDVKVVAVEPETSPVLSKGTAGPHKIQGIGAGFVPEVLDTRIYDEVFPVANEDAFTTGKELAKAEGVLVGISSGAALYAAIELAKRPENKGKTIVALLPDSGDRYYSTALFAD